MKKRKIRINSSFAMTGEINYLDCTIVEFIEKLKEINEDLNSKGSCNKDNRINIDYVRGYYDSIEPYLEIYGKRLETDDELFHRIQNNKKLLEMKKLSLIKDKNRIDKELSKLENS